MYTLEKNANTAINELFSLIDRDERYDIQPSTVNAKEHNVFNYNLTLRDISVLISNSSWTKAVIYRDPLSRFLSAYRSKCGGFDNDGLNWCRNAFGSREVNFEQAILKLYHFQIERDPHFARQSEFCGGLRTSLDHYQFKFEMSSRTLRKHLSKLFQWVNLTHPDNSKFVAKFNRLFPSARSEEDAIRYRRIGARNTHSSVPSNLLTYYKKQCYIRTVVDFYQSDYDLFKIQYPKWAIQALENTSRESCENMSY